MDKIILEVSKKDVDIIIAGLGKLLAEVSFTTICIVQDQLRKQMGKKDAKESPGGVHEKQRENNSQPTEETAKTT